jgi:hypothetical protein
MNINHKVHNDFHVKVLNHLENFFSQTQAINSNNNNIRGIIYHFAVYLNDGTSRLAEQFR